MSDEERFVADEEAVEFVDDGDDEDVSRSQIDRINDEIFRAHKNALWVDDIEKADPTWGQDEDVPEDVKQWVADTIEMMDPMYDDFDDVPEAAALTVHKEIRESLTQPQGWSINSIVNRLVSDFPEMDAEHAETIARMESAACLNKAREVALRARKDTVLVDWVGPDDEDTTKICKVVKEEINRRGGAVEIGVLKDILEETASKYEKQGGTPNRIEELVPHFRCRHTMQEKRVKKFVARKD